MNWDEGKARNVAPVLHFLCAAVASLVLVGCGGGSSDGGTRGAAADTRETAKAIAAPTAARWSPIIPLPLVPAAAANLPDGKVLMWSAEERFAFLTGPVGRTYTTVLDPATGVATDRLVTETGHDMFCPGTTNLPDGRLLITGGIDSAKSSIYDAATGTWSTAAAMNIPRGYQANTLLQDGSVFTLGGSFSGGSGNKHGELWTTTGGWRRLTGVPVGDFQTNDKAGTFRSDNHMWLIPTANGQILHAGPSTRMHWIDPRGDGSVRAAGVRGDDTDSMSGTTVMYDVGKVMKTGGSLHYDSVNANANTYVIDTNGGLTVRKTAPMNYIRVFHNSVVLPNGQVLVVGGQTYAAPLSDNNSVLAPELWDPATERFTVLPPMQVPRNYHGNALLLPDARVLVAGGGLCGGGCAANHPDAEILTPHYLINDDGSMATRPVITAAPAQANHGATVTVSTNMPVTSMALVRLSSTTHTVNNDQRRIPLAFTTTGGTSYSVDIPTNPGIALPGIYMLFAMNGEGVPSVARMIRIGNAAAGWVNWPGDRTGAVGTPVSLTVTAVVPGGTATTFSAIGLPPGLTMSGTGIVTGSPTSGGTYRTSLQVTTPNGTVSTEMVWTISGAATPGTTARYVRLEQVREWAGRAWASMAEFNVLDTAGNTLARTGWVASADSAETGAGGAAPAALAIDGSAGSIWHTQWMVAAPPPPHTFTVDMGTARAVGGFRYLPRQDGNTAGIIDQYRFYLSNDGINWGTPVAEGSFATMGAAGAEKTVRFGTAPPGNQPPTITSPGPQTSTVGLAVGLDIAASDPEGAALSYSATGLPAGLAITAGTGRIAGTPTTAGTSTTTVTVRDPAGGTASASFAWTVSAAAGTVVNPVPAAPAPSGGSVTWTASATGTGLAYAWDFGDGSPPTDFGPSPTVSHVYAAPGLYTVTLRVRNAAGTITSRSFSQAVYAAATAGRPASSSNIVLEPRSGANPRLWVVNQDNNTVSVFDATTNAKQAEIGVGAGPRTLAVRPNGQVWVANRDGGTISVISTASLGVVQTIAMPRASQPFGIVFSPADSAAYVTLEGTGQLVRVDGGGAITGTLAVGPHPRQLAVTGDGARLLISRFITPPLPGESTAAVNVAAGGGEVLQVRTAPLGLLSTTLLRHSDRADTPIQGRGIPNYLGGAAIAPDGASAWVPSKQDNVLRGALRDGEQLDFQNTVRAITSRIDLGSGAEDGAARIDHDNTSVASAAAYHPTGAYLFVALETSREVAVVDPVGQREVMRFEAGRAPQGLVVSADGLKLYVSNFMDRSVTVHDLTRLVNFGELVVPAPATLASVAAERLTAQVLAGKRFFYDARDPRLAREGYMSCATCHRDGDSDGRTWDMTGFGEGLRNTISLVGRAGMGQGRLHWSGNFDEVQDFEAQIRRLAGGSGLMTDAQFNAGTRNQPLGDRKAGVSADLDALAAYVGSLAAFEPSPFRTATGALTATATAGRTVFAANCVACHGGSGYTDSASNILRDIGTLTPASGQRLGAALTGIDPPTLRDAWSTAPYFHDGSAATLADAVRRHDGIALGDTELDQVVAFVQQIGSEEPAVGGTTPPPENTPPTITPPAARTGTVGTATSFTPAATDTDGDTLSWSATGLPPGLTLTAATGTISGTPTTAGSYTTTLTVADGRGGTASASFAWTISPTGGGTPGGTTARYVRLEEVTEILGRAWASMAEFNVVDPSGATISRAGWVATASSAETGAGGAAPASMAIDGSTGSMWHTQWMTASPRPPHTFTVDMGSTRTIGGFKYLPRQDGNTPGVIAQFRFYVSTDGVNWGSPVASGDFTTMGATAAEKTVMFGGTTPPPANRPPTVTTPAARTATVGTATSFTMTGSDPDGDTLAWSATGLPPGLAIAAATGVISGTPTTAGTYSSTVTAADGRGGSTPVTFGWTVGAGGGGTPGRTARYVRLEQVTEVEGRAWASMAEFNLTDAAGATIPRTGWVASADSAETSAGAAAPASMAIDGSTGSMWHTQWVTAAPRPPHTFTVDLGTARTIGGFRYLPRQDGNSPGVIAQFRFYLSTDGVNWGTPVVTGDFSTMGARIAEKTVRLP